MATAPVSWQLEQLSRREEDGWMDIDEQLQRYRKATGTIRKRLFPDRLDDDASEGLSIEACGESGHVGI